MRFASAKLLNLVGQNALIYGLFILIISQHKSALATGAFVLTANIPSIVLGLPSGVVADRFPQKATLIATLGLRIAIVWWLFAGQPGAAATILLTLATWSIYQFYSPAESAALPAVADGDRMAAANAWLNGISLAGQIGGAGVVAPLMVKAFGGDGLFLIVLALLLLSTWLFATIPDLTVARDRRKERVNMLRALPQGWRAIGADAVLRRIILLTIVMDTAIFVVIVATPTFIREVLKTDPANAVYIAAPSAVGILVGLVLAPILLKLLGARLVVTLGFAMVAGVILTLPFVHGMSLALDQATPLRQVQSWLNVPADIAAVALLLPIAGMGMTFVHVASNTAVYQHTGEGMVAQVFATEAAISSIVSIVPAIGAGLLIDLLGAPAVLVMAGSLSAIAGLALLSGPLQHAGQPATALETA
ncbi:MAG: MFS transporter [Chloroflexota bacterium]|nr:MFS transporter [Chloroflexota bacterium]